MIVEQSKAILAEVSKAFIGKNEIVKKVLMTIYAGGHILLEDCPGVGKTTLAVAFSKTLGLSSKRIQFTPDDPCRPTSQASRCSTAKQTTLSTATVRQTASCCSPMRSTVPPRKRSPHCWRSWRTHGYGRRAKRTCCPRRLSASQRRIRSVPPVRSLCRNRSSTVS